MAQMAGKSITDRKESVTKDAERGSTPSDPIWLASTERKKTNEVISRAG